MFVVLGDDDNSLQRRLFKFTGCRVVPAWTFLENFWNNTLRTILLLNKLLDFFACLPRRSDDVLLTINSALKNTVL